jgi:hypothetical protein
MYVNLSRTHFCTQYCNVKAVGITYSECEFVALGIQNVTHVRHIFICGLSGCTNVSTLSHKRHDFQEKKFPEHKICFDFPNIFCLKSFLF